MKGQNSQAFDINIPVNALMSNEADRLAVLSGQQSPSDFNDALVGGQQWSAAVTK
jgi:hypothetical protein